MKRGAAPAGRIVPLLFAGLVLIYTAGFLLWYGATPLGRFPVLDERELIALAVQIADGTLPHEAFYRAPGYSALLAAGLRLGVPAPDLPLLARGLNALCHLTTTWLVWQAARRLWERCAAAVIAATLVGFNPLLLHFAGDALDITLAITLTCAGCDALLRAERGPARDAARGFAWAGLWFALGTLVRPQILPLGVALGVLALASGVPWKERARRATAGLFPLTAALLAFGSVNFALSGDFRVLPWQGAYNLWAANRPGAHGRYFEQSLRVQTYDEAANTARIESERLYRQRQGAAGDYRAQTAHWQAQAVTAIAADPLRWLALLARKTFYLVNDVEQYNNKTFAFHKARSPWLAANPIRWAVVLAVAMAGFMIGRRDRGVRALGLLMLAYAAGTLVYFVSDRFRAPLVPMLAIAAGGVAVAAPGVVRARAALIGAVATALSLVPIPRAEREKTFVQDEMALARASSALGEHADALGHARAAARRDASRTAVQDLLCITRFNVWLYEVQITSPWTELERACAAAAASSPAARRVLAYVWWHAGREDAAGAVWRALVDDATPEADPALAALVATGQLRAGDTGLAGIRASAGALPVLVALAWRGHPAATAALDRRVGAAARDAQLRAMGRLFGRD